MRKAIAGIVLLAVLAVGGVIYYWGIGGFWPCEPLPRLFGDSQCRQVQRLEGRQLQEYARLQDGTMLGITRAHGIDPAEPLELVEFDLASGQMQSQIPLTGLPNDRSITALVVNHDASRILIDSLSGPATLLDRQGEVLGDYRWNVGGNAAFYGTEGQVLADPGINRRGIPDIDNTLIRDINQSDRWALPFLGPFPEGFFSRGVGTVLSPDGTIYARDMEVNTDTGLAAIAVGNVSGLGALAPGHMVGAVLRPGCDYTISRLAFSPDGDRLAAAFACSDRWGMESSALVVWDILKKETLARIPSNEWWDSPYWLDNDTLLAGRYSADWQVSELFEIDLSEEESR